MTKLSIIVPCYNEQAALPAFYEAVTGVVSGLPGVEPEYLFVDDGSRDNTLPILRELAGRDGRVRYLSFSRNFGKEAAILAGLAGTAAAAWVATTLDVHLLRRFFGAFLIYIGVRELFRRPRA